MYCYGLRSYKYLTLALLRGRQISPHFPFIFVCVHFQATVAPSYLVLSLFVFLYHACSPNLIPPIAICHSHPGTCAFCPLVISSSSCLDCSPITYACGSRNNKPCTPPLCTLMRILPLGMLLRFYFLYCTLLNSHADIPSAFILAAPVSSVAGELGQLQSCLG